MRSGPLCSTGKTTKPLSITRIMAWEPHAKPPGRKGRAPLLNCLLAIVLNQFYGERQGAMHLELALIAALSVKPISIQLWGALHLISGQDPGATRARQNGQRSAISVRLPERVECIAPYPSRLPAEPVRRAFTREAGDLSPLSAKPKPQLTPSSLHDINGLYQL